MSDLFGEPEPPKKPKPLATAGQVARLAKFGVAAAGMTRGQAGAILGELALKLTPRQIKTLGNAGEDLGMHPTKCGAVLTIMAARGWRPRNYLLLANRWGIRPTDKGYRPVFHDPEIGAVLMDFCGKTERAARKWIACCVEDEQSHAVPRPANLFTLGGV